MLKVQVPTYKHTFFDGFIVVAREKSSWKELPCSEIKFTKKKFSKLYTYLIIFDYRAIRLPVLLNASINIMSVRLSLYFIFHAKNSVYLCTEERICGIRFQHPDNILPEIIHRTNKLIYSNFHTFS